MNVESLCVRNFRNHHESALEFGEGMNILVGGNGQGKTNILEAISYLGLTKSFFSAADATVLQYGENGFSVDGSVVSCAGSSHAVQIRFDRLTGLKEISINGVLLDRPTSLIGRFPVVVLSPESSRITSGPPGERRRFLDMVLAQRSRSYLEDLLEYRRVLRQRNRLLFEAKGSRGLDEQILDPWTENLVRTGSRIMARRREFVSEFLKVLLRTHQSLAGSQDEIEVSYRSIPAVSDGADSSTIAAEFCTTLETSRTEEMRRGLTLAGPQRDDLVMTLNRMSVQDHASQGQHKTLLLSMKIAECDYLSSALEENPVLLLDDLFGELDMERSERIVRLISTLGQSIITATSDKTFGGTGTVNANARRFLVKSGTCEALA